MTDVTRRGILGAAAAAPLAAPALAATSKTKPFEATWDSLVTYRAPDWFRDAKFGIWAHWGPQCIAEMGDWYGRRMYIQGEACYDYHLKTYGHPTEVGFMDLLKDWRVPEWKPRELLAFYKRSGARYFVGMAAHHDNFDNFASTHQPWNSVNIGPKKDLIGGWAQAARDNDLRFGVSNHVAHGWHWWQTAYGYDAEGPRAGQRYDAFTRSRADGAGKWWDGLDPQALYSGRNMVVPDGFKTIAQANAWHADNDAKFNVENIFPANAAFAPNWLARVKEVSEKYSPDLLYFDNGNIPFGQLGLEAMAHYYNTNMARHGGDLQGVINLKGLSPAHRPAAVRDVERGFLSAIADGPWQTDTCIGGWHYSRPIYEKNLYKTAPVVIHRLCDIVSKNGNLLLSIPVRADGSIDEKEHAIVEAIGDWMRINGEAIYGTRPWRTFGEGPTKVVEGAKAENQASLTADDIRFTRKPDALYAMVMGMPPGRSVSIKTLAERAPFAAGRIERVELLGSRAPLKFTRDAQALTVELPASMPPTPAPVLKIRGQGLV